MGYIYKYTNIHIYLDTDGNFYLPNVSVGFIRPGCMSNTTNTVASFLLDVSFILLNPMFANSFTVSLFNKTLILNLFFLFGSVFFTLQIINCYVFYFNFRRLPLMHLYLLLSDF